MSAEINEETVQGAKHHYLVATRFPSFFAAMYYVHTKQTSD